VRYCELRLVITFSQTLLDTGLGMARVRMILCIAPKRLTGLGRGPQRIDNMLDRVKRESMLRGTFPRVKSQHPRQQWRTASPLWSVPRELALRVAVATAKTNSLRVGPGPRPSPWYQPPPTAVGWRSVWMGRVGIPVGHHWHGV
jgi:hypothetical protein